MPDAKTVSHKLGSTAIGTQAFTTSTGGTLTTGLFVRANNRQVLGTFEILQSLQLLLVQ